LRRVAKIGGGGRKEEEREEREEEKRGKKGTPSAFLPRSSNSSSNLPLDPLAHGIERAPRCAKIEIRRSEPFAANDDLNQNSNLTRADGVHRGRLYDLSAYQLTSQIDEG